MSRCWRLRCVVSGVCSGSARNPPQCRSVDPLYQSAAGNAGHEPAWVSPTDSQVDHFKCCIFCDMYNIIWKRWVKGKFKDAVDVPLIKLFFFYTSVFEDAVRAAGLDFHSDRLWDLYVEWEKEQGNMRNAAAVLDRVLKVPTQLYNTHYDK